ncbi:hypothetical protein Gohar_009830 [Gossypium harknessii]|uniref:Uncharacterized protein n=2 Tax=Gossypium TaxID=3633 RepID=A0A7J9GQD1_9ROSI|nr:hypothetical protein [Gossypium harknessii]
MISARKLIKLARKWQKMAAIKRKRITFSTTASMVEKGHFVVYSADEKRFMLPLEYLKNEMVMELFTLAEEEFGIPSNGHLILPFDSTFLEYTIGLIKRKASKEVEKALIIVSPINLRVNKMVSAKKLIQLARKWQRMAAIKRKRITLPTATLDTDTNSSSTSTVAEKGHFVVYSVDQKRFVLPLEYLKNEIVMELFNLAEEEFGVPGNGLLILPCDATFMEYVIALIKKKPSKDVEKALILSVASSRCSSSNLYQHETSQQLPIWSF